MCNARPTITFFTLHTIKRIWSVQQALEGSQAYPELIFHDSHKTCYPSSSLTLRDVRYMGEAGNKEIQYMTGPGICTQLSNNAQSLTIFPQKKTLITARILQCNSSRELV